MTEYKDKSGKPLTSVATQTEFDECYFFKAVEACLRGEDNVTFLPCTGKLGGCIATTSTTTSGFGSERETREAKAREVVIQETIKKTFENGNPEIDNNLINSIICSENRRGVYWCDNTEPLRKAITSQVAKDSEWFGKLSPTAQLLAITLDPSLEKEKGVNFDFNRDSSSSESDLENAADVVFGMAYTTVSKQYRSEHVGLMRKRDIQLGRPTHDYETVSKTVSRGTASWELKVAGVEAIYKCNSIHHNYGGGLAKNDVKDGILEDVITTAKTPEQLEKLTSIMKQYYTYDLASSVLHNLDKVPSLGKTTEELFFAAMENYSLKDNHRETQREIGWLKLPQNSPNYQALQNAKTRIEISSLRGEIRKDVLKDMDRLNEGPTHKGVEQGVAISEEKTRSTREKIKTSKMLQESLDR